MAQELESQFLIGSDQITDFSPLSSRTIVNFLKNLVEEGWVKKGEKFIVTRGKTTFVADPVVFMCFMFLSKQLPCGRLSDDFLFGVLDLSKARYVLTGFEGLVEIFERNLAKSDQITDFSPLSSRTIVNFLKNLREEGWVKKGKKFMVTGGKTTFVADPVVFACFMLLSKQLSYERLSDDFLFGVLDLFQAHYILNGVEGLVEIYEKSLAKVASSVSS